MKYDLPKVLIPAPPPLPPVFPVPPILVALYDIISTKSPAKHPVFKTTILPVVAVYSLRANLTPFTNTST